MLNILHSVLCVRIRSTTFSGAAVPRPQAVQGQGHRHEEDADVQAAVQTRAKVGHHQGDGAPGNKVPAVVVGVVLRHNL